MDHSSTEVKGHQKEATEENTNIRDKEQEEVSSDRLLSRVIPTEFELHGASVERQTLGQHINDQCLRLFKEKIPGLLGKQNIIQIQINDIATTALFDTGATIR